MWQGTDTMNPDQRVPMNGFEEEASPTKREAMTGFGAMVRIRCPECKKGIVFRHGMEINHLCPYCGIKFDREPGYFTGAIWIAVIIALPVMLCLMCGFIYFFRSLHPVLWGLLAALSFIPLLPLTIRLSRSIWMYLDHQMHPQGPNRKPPDDRGGDRLQPVPEGSGDGMAADVESTTDNGRSNGVINGVGIYYAVNQKEQPHAHPVEASRVEMLANPDIHKENWAAANRMR